MKIEKFSDLINVVSIRTYNKLILNGIDSIDKLKEVDLNDFSKNTGVSFNTCMQVSGVLKNYFNIDAFEKTGNLGMMIIANRFNYKLCGNN